MRATGIKSYGAAVALGVVAAAAVFSIVGIAGGLMTAQCSLGAIGCFSDPAPAVAARTAPEPSAPEVDVAEPLQLAVDQPAAAFELAPSTPAASERHDTIIADTFDALGNPGPATVVAANSGPGDSSAKAKLPMKATEAQRLSIAAADGQGTAADAIAREVPDLPRPAPEHLAYAQQPAAITTTTEPAGVRVGGSSVNVRAAGRVTSERLFVLRPGDDVTASEQSGGWVHIEDGEGRSGWVDAGYLTNLKLDDLPVADAAAEKPVAAPAKVATAPKASSADRDVRTVGGAGVNVRSGPSRSHGKLFALVAGEDVEVTETEKGWLKIVDAKGRAGWLYQTYVH